jgi:hypothetical protein
VLLVFNKDSCIKLLFHKNFHVLPRLAVFCLEHQEEEGDQHELFINFAALVTSIDKIIVEGSKADLVAAASENDVCGAGKFMHL